MVDRAGSEAAARQASEEPGNYKVPEGEVRTIPNLSIVATSQF